MAYRDLRAYMKQLEEASELVAVNKEVEWNLEIGAIISRIYEKGGPSIHFKKIKGYPDRVTILGAPIGKGRDSIWKKLLLALQINPETTYPELVEIFIKRKNSPIKPIQVKTGPCKENIVTGEEVDLFDFPAPYLHEGDGGRYLGTWGSTISKDPEREWINWGMYRHMIHNKNTLGGMILPTSDGAYLYYKKYMPRGEPMPFAIAIGTEPVISIASATSLPPGISEADIAGGLRKEPLHLVKCETNDLMIPATAEIVLEGIVPPHDRWDEGPFGDYTGYRVSPRIPRPIFRVQCITHRDTPILPVSSPGMPIHEWNIINGLSFDAAIMEEFRKRGWPVKGCFTPPWLCGHYVIVSTKIPYAHFSHQLYGAIKNTIAGPYVQYVQVCDDDVEPTNVKQVLHALVTKCHPRRGTQLIAETRGNPFIPFLSSEERKIAKSSSITLDSTWPTDWDPQIAVPPRASFDQIYPKDVQEKVLKNWNTLYGMPEKKLKGISS